MIDAQTRGGVRWLTLDRPGRANALTAAMLERLTGEVAAAAGPIVLTGAGDGPFSAGADLDEARAGLATSPLWERLSGAVAAHPDLTVAALNGTCAGGALGMVLACDIRLSVPGARFFYPVAKLGFLPQPSDPGRLAALVGPGRARLILAAGARIDAAEALAFGLVDRIVPDAAAAAAALLEGGGEPGHVARIKGMVPGT